MTMPIQDEQHHACIEREQLTLKSADKRHIVAMNYKVANAKSVVIISPAMGMPQTLYEKFAFFLTGHGYAVISYDYTGFGLSLKGPLKYCKTTARELGELDGKTVIDFAKQAYPDLKLQWIGHSLGGQLLGIMPNANELSNAITVASGTGYWLYNKPQVRRTIWFVWYVIAPLSTKILGYFPGKALGIVADLPPNVIDQWRRWCCHKDYASGVEGPVIRKRYASLKTPVKCISFTDDHFLTKRNVEGLHNQFTSAEVDYIDVKPEAIGIDFVGHLNWYKEKFKHKIWQEIILAQLL